METLASIKEWLVTAALVFFGAMVVALCWMRVGNWFVEQYLKAWRRFSPVGRTVFFIAILIATLHAQKPGTNGQQRVGNSPAPLLGHRLATPSLRSVGGYDSTENADFRRRSPHTKPRSREDVVKVAGGKSARSNGYSSKAVAFSNTPHSARFAAHFVRGSQIVEADLSLI